MRRIHNLLVWPALVLLTACATTQRFDTSAVDESITPEQAITGGQTLAGASVIWGGVVIGATNLKDATQIEILSYPLSSKHKPLTGKSPRSRFLARVDGYLETAQFTEGRQITVVGQLQGNSTGRIGESDYIYPVVKVTQHHLWAKERPVSNPRFHFGIGVRL